MRETKSQVRKSRMNVGGYIEIMDDYLNRMLIQVELLFGPKHTVRFSAEVAGPKQVFLGNCAHSSVISEPAISTHALWKGNPF